MVIIFNLLSLIVINCPKAHENIKIYHNTWQKQETVLQYTISIPNPNLNNIILFVHDMHPSIILLLLLLSSSSLECISYTKNVTSRTYKLINLGSYVCFAREFCMNMSVCCNSISCACLYPPFTTPTHIYSQYSTS